MDIFNSKKEIEKIDKEGVYESVVSLPKQCEHAWSDVEKVKIPSSYQNIENIVFTGMGGSGLTARVIESAFFKELRVTFTRINDYNLPSFVNSKSLVVCSSYSGTTEETIENVRQSIEKKAKWVAIGTGGKLIEEARKHKVPFYQIVPKYNPCNQPRMAIGYSIVGQLALASKLGIIDITKSNIATSMQVMNKVISENKLENTSSHNPAKKLAKRLKDKIVILVSAQHLVGATHVFNNQINENSKTFSSDFVIPELNHHLMEGLKNPKTNKKNIFVIFVKSSLYSKRIQKRFSVTKDVVSQNGVESEEILIKSLSKLDQVFELIQYGAFVNFYLSILYKQNPAPIPWVDYFKKELSKI